MFGIPVVSLSCYRWKKCWISFFPHVYILFTANIFCRKGHLALYFFLSSLSTLSETCSHLFHHALKSPCLKYFLHLIYALVYGTYFFSLLLKDALLCYVYKHSVFIQLVVSWASIFSNKVDLSHVNTSLNLWPRSLCWNYKTQITVKLHTFL